jgi:hypothetical protein
MTPSRGDRDSVTGVAVIVAQITTTTSVLLEETGKQEIPTRPQHDPYTPRKRRDPDYVPYYVTNFEYILRCVIDCTDDRDLFSSEELGTATSVFFFFFNDCGFLF